MALINLRNALMAGKRTPTAKDYVQDGLVAMWDGIENVGWGIHDPNATTWKDLVGVGEIPVLSFGDDYAIVGASVSLTDQYLLTALSGSMSTIEMLTVFGVAQLSRYLDNLLIEPSNSYIMFRNYSYGTSINTATGLRYVYGVQNKFFPFPYTSDYIWTARLSLVRDGSSVVAYYNTTNGLSHSSYTTTTQPTEQATSMKLKRSGSPKVFAMRIYSRALTASEIAANYAIDKARFGLS